MRGRLLSIEAAVWHVGAALLEALESRPARKPSYAGYEPRKLKR